MGDRHLTSLEESAHVVAESQINVRVPNIDLVILSFAFSYIYLVVSRQNFAHYALHIQTGRSEDHPTLQSR
jgi:hypothetical protein